MHSSKTSRKLLNLKTKVPKPRNPLSRNLTLLLRTIQEETKKDKGPQILMTTINKLNRNTNIMMITTIIEVSMRMKVSKDLNHTLHLIMFQIEIKEIADYPLQVNKKVEIIFLHLKKQRIINIINNSNIIMSLINLKLMLMIWSMVKVQQVSIHLIVIKLYNN